MTHAASQTSRRDEHEFDFALIVRGVSELADEVQDALFEAGCDDATVSMQHGLLYIEFSRAAKSLKDAILSAIRDVQRSRLALRVLRVDECDLVTASEIARRINRSRQLVYQYINGQRGPGGFPPPECHLMDHAPLWAWCAVSHWLSQNNLLRPEECRDAEVLWAINTVLEEARHEERTPGLREQIARELEEIGLQ